MKKLSLLAGCITGICIISIISWKTAEIKISSEPENEFLFTENSPVIALRKIKLKTNVTAAAFEEFAAKVAADEYGKLPGVQFYFGKGERGDEPGSYVLFMIFDSKSTRDYYAPAEDDNRKRSPDASRMVDAYFAKYNPEFGKLAEVITAAGKKGYVDYVIVK